MGALSIGALVLVAVGLVVAAALLQPVMGRWRARRRARDLAEAARARGRDRALGITTLWPPAPVDALVRHARAGRLHCVGCGGFYDAQLLRPCPQCGIRLCADCDVEHWPALCLATGGSR